MIWNVKRFIFFFIATVFKSEISGFPPMFTILNKFTNQGFSLILNFYPLFQKNKNSIRRFDDIFCVKIRMALIKSFFCKIKLVAHKYLIRK